MEKLHHIRKRIVGKRVVEVRQEEQGPYSDWRGNHGGTTLILNDGTELFLYMSESDCCASAHGTWTILDKTRLDAVITDVVFDQTKDHEYDGDGHESEATITILHNQNKLALAECHANDGNGGYYYSCLALRVKVPKKPDLVAQVIES